MKFLLFIVIALVVVWLWRSSRSKGQHTDAAAPPPAPGPQEMVRCAHCGVHLLHDDAQVGRIGLYCSAEHRQLAEP